MSISISDWIQAIAVVVSLVTGAISIGLSSIAIKQSAKANEQNALSIELTKQAAEDMARPYVNVYVDIFAIKKHSRVFTFKNFGQTPAYIKSIQVNGYLGKHNGYQFQSLVGNMLAPGQKITSAIEDHFRGVGNVTVIYADVNGKEFEDTFKLDTQIFEDFAYILVESNKSDKVPSAIRQSTMALLRELR